MQTIFHLPIIIYFYYKKEKNKLLNAFFFGIFKIIERNKQWGYILTLFFFSKKYLWIKNVGKGTIKIVLFSLMPCKVQNMHMGFKNYRDKSVRLIFTNSYRVQKQFPAPHCYFQYILRIMLDHSTSKEGLESLRGYFLPTFFHKMVSTSMIWERYYYLFLINEIGKKRVGWFCREKNIVMMKDLKEWKVKSLNASRQKVI